MYDKQVTVVSETKRAARLFMSREEGKAWAELVDLGAGGARAHGQSD